MTRWMKSFEISFWFLFSIIGIIFAFLCIINSNLILGFAIGSLTSYFLFKITILSYFKFLNRKKLFLLLVMFKMLIFFILIFCLFLVVRQINLKHLSNPNYSWVFGKINVIVLSLSLSLSQFALLIQIMVEKVINKYYRRAYEGRN
ncbi:Uncharacterised protein (plasmid) [Mycoplasmopsis cynos]|uniref:Uncharacterized protein n=1 Tax=Mycoplasmopsis cynos TaxID=171284 RepID=A0A449AI39_9BACT|nr:hypothetical protein E1I74_01030 [Mycoplasmopsis cynos]VEU64650.1 Uncharacterised protein [Mycoplasmopsis cynos]